MKTTAREVEGQISGRGGGRDDDGGRGGRDGDGSGLLGPLPVGGRLLLPHLDDQGQGRADRRLLALLPRHLGVRLLAIVVPIGMRMAFSGRKKRPCWPLLRGEGGREYRSRPPPPSVGAALFPRYIKQRLCCCFRQIATHSSRTLQLLLALQFAHN